MSHTGNKYSLFQTPSAVASAQRPSPGTDNSLTSVNYPSIHPQQELRGAPIWQTPQSHQNCSYPQLPSYPTTNYTNNAHSFMNQAAPCYPLTQYSQTQDYANLQTNSAFLPPAQLLFTQGSKGRNRSEGTAANGAVAAPPYNYATSPQWMKLAEEGKPIDRAVVILQGELPEGLMHQLQRNLLKMGFEQDIHIYHKRGVISRQTASSWIQKLLQGRLRGSNLLLMICQGDLHGIDVDVSYLKEHVYGKVMQYNHQQNEEFCKEVKNLRVRDLDTRKYEGITLHVLLDGIEGAPLKQVLKFHKKDGVLESFAPIWDQSICYEKGQKHVLKNDMGTGQVVQFWVDRRMFGYEPFLLLRAFTLIVLEEPEIPYYVLLLRINMILNKTALDISPSMKNLVQNQCGLRSGAELLASPCAFALAALWQAYQKRQLEMGKVRFEKEFYRGIYILSSADKFDPHLCLKFNWR